MKVGIDSRAAIWYRGTGMGTYTYQLIRNIYLIDKKNEYHFFLPHESFQGTDPLTSGVFQSISQSKDAFWETVIAAETINPEGMNVFHVPQNGIGLPPEKTCPTVVTVHDLIPYVLEETVGPGYLKIFQREMPRILDETDHIITVSEHSKKDLQEIMHVPEERITVIYEAPESTYKPIKRDVAKARIKNKYGIGENFILYIGGFSPRKNLRGLINAYHKIYKDIKMNCKLVILGKHSRDYHGLVDLVERLDLQERVLFPGFIPVQDLPFFYNAAELFVYPSFYEGFGLPPIEALACGTPTITSNVSSLPEVVDGAAILINPRDILALATAMHRVLTEPELAQELKKKGPKRASEFSWTKTAGQTIKVYQDVLR
ncbi:MAG: glycosyltransferase family 1 protein [Desulfitobacteriaceae bacterium]|nr:glycosyltransferase family 1 protein [Desulfitobacteriaceae bacterium]MDD4752075.1 glycosyltransferase family 1 protein [Desulfitobacteriaceae bacterium]